MFKKQRMLSVSPCTCWHEPIFQFQPSMANQGKWQVRTFPTLHTWGLSTTVCTLMGAGDCIWVVTLAGELSRLDEPL